MKMISIRNFREHATRYIRSKEPLLVMRGAKPAGVFLPWDEAVLPADALRRLVYDRLTTALRQEMAEKRVSDAEVLADFDADRQRRP